METNQTGKSYIKCVHGIVSSDRCKIPLHYFFVKTDLSVRHYCGFHKNYTITFSISYNVLAWCPFSTMPRHRHLHWTLASSISESSFERW